MVNAGKKLKVSTHSGVRIKKSVSETLENPDWTAEEKTSLADMLQEWAGKLMALDAASCASNSLSALRGLA